MTTPMVHTAPRLLTLLATAMTVAGACAPAPADEPADAVTSELAVADPRDGLLLASAKVALPPSGTRLEDLPDPQSAGARYVQTFCATCHDIPSPAMHSATDWPGVVRRMWLRMGQLGPAYTVPVPEAGERLVLLEYLTANALKVSHASLPDAPEREIFETTCSQCHELPDPRQHSPADWSLVTRRMNEHMRTILGRELTAAQLEEITRYLARISA